MQLDLEDLIRSIPDFPKKGILFRDITTLLRSGQGFKQAVQAMASHYKQENVDKVVCVEARGFLLGGAIAYELGCGVVPIRKPGKLPYKTVCKSYELEYGTDTLEIHEDAFHKGDRVIVADDLLATGGTVKTVVSLVEQLGAEVVECAFLAELDFLKGRDLLPEGKVYSLLRY